MEVGGIVVYVKISVLCSSLRQALLKLSKKTTVVMISHKVLIVKFERKFKLFHPLFFGSFYSFI